jgi:hypothetical protein
VKNVNLPMVFKENLTNFKTLNAYNKTYGALDASHRIYFQNLVDLHFIETFIYNCVSVNENILHIPCVGVREIIYTLDRVSVNVLKMVM